MTRGGQVADHALGIRAFRHVFHKRGFDAIAQGGFNGFAAFIMLAHPAHIRERRNIHEADFERLFWGRIGL